MPEYRVVIQAPSRPIQKVCLVRSRARCLVVVVAVVGGGDLWCWQVAAQGEAGV